MALAVGALALWHGQAQAACDAEILDALFLEDAAFVPAQSAPCCLASDVTPPLAADKPGSNPLPARARDASRVPAYGQAPARRAHATGPLAWRPYCARSLRLLD